MMLVDERLWLLRNEEKSNDNNFQVSKLCSKNEALDFKKVLNGRIKFMKLQRIKK